MADHEFARINSWIQSGHQTEGGISARGAQRHEAWTSKHIYLYKKLKKKYCAFHIIFSNVKKNHTFLRLNRTYGTQYFVNRNMSPLEIIIMSILPFICIGPKTGTPSFSKDMVRQWNFCAALIHSLLCEIQGRDETASMGIRPHAQETEWLQYKNSKMTNVNHYFSKNN